MAKAPEGRPSSAKERHALLQRILWSHQIKNSERIRDFLVYVCERALQAPDADIHEQEIGCRVFARKPDYDTAVDNIVHGALEPIILEIPKGKYTPVFRERDALPQEFSAGEQAQPAAA